MNATARVARADALDTNERYGVRFAGQHLLIDLFGARRLDDIEHVERTLKRCVEAAGATLLHIHLHHLAPQGGVTGVAVLAESHISIHSWPETGYAALDVFMSGDAKPHLAVSVLKDAFKAQDVVVKTHLRGADLESPKQSAAQAKKAEPQRLRSVKRAKVAA